MSFFILGLALLIFGIYFIRKASKENDKEGVIGLIAIIIAGFILIIFFGLFFRIIF